jgi:hypothetical protein
MARNNFHQHSHRMDRDALDDDKDDDRPQSGREDRRERCEAAPVTFNQFDTVNYLHADIKADGSGVERFILQVNGVEQNGAHVTLPGLGSDFGMYFIIDATLAPSAGPPIFNSLNIALMVDPGNNDGAASATLTGASFANGAGGDFALATGTLVSAALSLDAIPAPGTRHATFLEQMTPTKDGLEAFDGSLRSGDLLQAILTTLPDKFTSVPATGGSTQLVNGGAGVVQLTPLKSLNFSASEVSGERVGVWD